MRLTWLADVLRDAGLTVHEQSGWKTRGSDLSTIRGITCHATAGSATSTDAGEINVLLNGSPSAPPPIAQLYLSRSGQWWVIASGRCNHNKTGWAGPNKGLGNSNLLGIEAQNDNRNQAWPDAQYQSYVRGVAALVRKLGIPVAHVAGHKEHQPAAGRPSGETSTKTDPTFDMNRFRADVARVLSGEDDDMPLTPADVKAIMTYNLTPSAKPGTEITVGRALLDGYRANAAVPGILAAIGQVDENVVERLRTAATPAEQAALLRAVLGDRAREVGALLAQG